MMCSLTGQGLAALRGGGAVMSSGDTPRLIMSTSNRGDSTWVTPETSVQETLWTKRIGGRPTLATRAGRCPTGSLEVFTSKACNTQGNAMLCVSRQGDMHDHSFEST